MTDHIITDLYDSGSDPTTASLPPMVPGFRLITRADVIDARPPEIAPEAWAEYFAPHPYARRAMCVCGEPMLTDKGIHGDSSRVPHPSFTRSTRPGRRVL